MMQNNTNEMIKVNKHINEYWLPFSYRYGNINNFSPPNQTLNLRTSTSS
jgi:hypothetical protein